MIFEEKLVDHRECRSASRYSPRVEDVCVPNICPASVSANKQNFEQVTSATALLTFYRSLGVSIETSRYTRLLLPSPFPLWLSTVVGGTRSGVQFCTVRPDGDGLLVWSGRKTSWAALLYKTQARASRKDGVPNDMQKGFHASTPVAGLRWSSCKDKCPLESALVWSYSNAEPSAVDRLHAHAFVHWISSTRLLVVFVSPPGLLALWVGRPENRQKASRLLEQNRTPTRYGSGKRKCLHSDFFSFRHQTFPRALGQVLDQR